MFTLAEHPFIRRRSKSINVFKKHGFKDKRDYIQQVASKLRVPVSFVRNIASIYGNNHLEMMDSIHDHIEVELKKAQKQPRQDNFLF